MALTKRGDGRVNHPGKETKVQPTMCEVNYATWNYMAETTSFNGANKIWIAPNRYLKMFWLVCLLAAACIMIYQLIQLTTTYFSYPVKTTVSLAFSPLVFPAITICNSNPIRLSQVYKLSCALQALLRVENRYKSKNCLNEPVNNETLSLGDPVMLCEKYNLYCSVNSTEDINLFSLRRKQIQLEIMTENRTLMQEVGHQIEEMIINCSFAGINCFSRSFFNEWSMEYGNCYTMNTSEMRSFDSGPPTGLDITFNLEMEEMLTSFRTGSGLRVVVHEQSTRPFPSSEGLTLSAGFETDFGLRVEDVSRLGGVYGTCKEDHALLFEDSRYKYSTKNCRNMCLEREEVNRCGCTDAIARTATPSENVPICTNVTEFNCTGQLNEEYIDSVFRGDSFCLCGDPCRELVYKVRMSARKWPIPAYVAVLEEELCHRAHITEEEVADCRTSKARLTLDERSSSFVRLRVYFESLNYENVIHEPFYDAERYLSDIGGTIGLWIGASLLGLGEALEMLYFSLILLYRYVWRGRLSPYANNNNRYLGQSAAALDVDRSRSRLDIFDINSASV